MATRLPSTLKWLVEKRSRLLGEIELMERRIAEAQLFEVQIESAKADIKALEHSIALFNSKIKVDHLEGIRIQGNKCLLEYGAITKMIYKCLGMDASRYFSTTEVTTFVIHALSLSLNDDEYLQLKLAVRKRLKTMKANGSIRVIQKKLGAEGSWQLLK